MKTSCIYCMRASGNKFALYWACTYLTKRLLYLVVSVMMGVCVHPTGSLISSVYTVHVQILHETIVA